MFCHQKLQVYQKAVKFLGAVLRIVRAIPAGNSDVVNQLRRAAMSITLNIAEGAGKTGLNDKKRFYAIARGSALECAAIFDLLLKWKLIDQEFLTPSIEELESIVAILSSLALNLKVHH